MITEIVAGFILDHINRMTIQCLNDRHREERKDFILQDGKVSRVIQGGDVMKKLMKIINIEAVILWLLSGLTLGSDSWIPFWVFIVTTIYLSLVAYATLEWKGEKNENTTGNQRRNQESKRCQKESRSQGRALQ